MTYSNRRDESANQGQQDDYFEQDLATAGQDTPPPASQADSVAQAYSDQGQQDNYFN